MATRCGIVRGLVKVVEEEINKFLATNAVHVLHLAQNESGDHMSGALHFEDLGHEHVGSGQSPWVDTEGRE